MRVIGCVFQDMTPPKSILRKSSDMQKPIQLVKFTKAIARHTKIRDQNPLFGYFCPGEPHQRSPKPPKFEDRVDAYDLPKDLNSAEMETFENTPAVLSLGKLCDENGYSLSGSTVKNHISLKTGFGYSATRRTSFQKCSRLVIEFFL